MQHATKDMGIDDKSSQPRVCSEVADGVTRNLVCLFREPDAGNLPVRFDEREQETELRQTGLRRAMRKQPNSHREAKATAPSRLYSYLLIDTTGSIEDQLFVNPRKTKPIAYSELWNSMLSSTES
jgi:hypothetical protein